MKIILTSFVYDNRIGAGASIVVNQLAHQLFRQKHDVIVLTTWAGTHVKTETIDEIKIIFLPASNLYWIGDKDSQPLYKKVLWQLIDIWNPMIFRLARQIFIEESPDILHSHKIRGLSPSIWSAAKSAGIEKIIHTCHDFEIMSPDGLLMGRVGSLVKNESLLIRPYQIIRRLLSRHVNTVTAPSKFLMNFHQQLKFFPNSKIRIVPNSHGMSLNEVKKSSSLSFRKNDELVTNFLYIGRLDKNKGIDVLCQAFSKLDEKNPNIVLRIAGWGPYNKELKDKYQGIKNITFTGPVFGDNKQELFQISDVLVTPSLAPESFGIVIIEAYSYGMPVIATRIGAYPEIIHEGETGFLTKPGSIDDLVNAISRFSKDKDLIYNMSKNCIKEAQKFTIETIVNNYLDIYEEQNYA